MKAKLFVILISLIGLSSCNQNALVDTFHELPETGWSYTEVISDSFEVSNPEFFHQLFVNLRISGEYEFANIYLKLSITAPDSSVKEETVTINLADKTGKWLGSGIGDIITYQEPILGKQNLKNAGIYKVKMEQFMRLENLPHVVSAGIMVKQLEELL